MRIEDPVGGTSPYAALAPVGVTPWTTHAEMQDVSFALQERALMDSRTQQAWNDLRAVRRRLLFDLYVYDVDANNDNNTNDANGNAPGGGTGTGPGAGLPDRATADPPPLWVARLLDDLIRFDR